MRRSSVRASLQVYFAPFKRWLPKSIWSPIRSVFTALITPVHFSTRTGHWKSSLQQAACAADGSPIPWYTYPAIDFLRQRSFEKCSILEFGGGQSTLWWSERAQSVLTIEEDRGWFEHIRSQIDGIRSNVYLHHIPVDHTTRTVLPIRAVIEKSALSKFDIIIIDGHLRKELTALAFEYLAPAGAIILDNAEGYGLYEEIRTKHCRRIDFFGFAPGVSLRHCTSIVFIADCFLLLPEVPIPVQA